MAGSHRGCPMSPAALESDAALILWEVVSPSTGPPARPRLRLGLAPRLSSENGVLGIPQESAPCSRHALFPMCSLRVIRCDGRKEGRSDSSRPSQPLVRKYDSRASSAAHARQPWSHATGATGPHHHIPARPCGPLLIIRFCLPSHVNCTPFGSP